METTRVYENYPVRIVLLSNLVSLPVYALGFLILLQTGWVISSAYLLFVMAHEYKIMNSHCVNCFYYGKICGFGKGRISSLFFKKGEAAKFCEKNISWKDMIPDLLISLIPLLTGITLLIIKFDFILVSGIILLIALTTFGNGFIRGSLTCKYCKQKEIGCPAEQLFSARK